MTETICFPVAGMTCSSCVNRITRALKRVDGVSRVKVDLARETATVRREPRALDRMLTEAVIAAGYDADLAAAVVVTDSARSGVVARLLGR